jgi:hypothetical protein
VRAHGRGRVESEHHRDGRDSSQRGRSRLDAGADLPADRGLRPLRPAGPRSAVGEDGQAEALRSAAGLKGAVDRVLAPLTH